MSNSTIRRPFVLHFDPNREDDSLLQLAALVAALRDTCVTLLAEKSNSAEEDILKVVDDLYETYYKLLQEQSNRNN